MKERVDGCVRGWVMGERVDGGEKDDRKERGMERWIYFVDRPPERKSVFIFIFSFFY